MTQRQGRTSMQVVLSEAQDRFITVWGQMASAWGISRTMSEVHALLYISGRPLCTDDVMERLQISRGNASMSIRALQEWGIVFRVHKRGDRKEYFETDRDVWAMFRTIARERKKRELDPVIALLYEIRDMTGVPDSAGEATASRPGDSPAVPPPATDDERARLADHNDRLDAMLRFMRAVDRLSQEVIDADPERLRLTFDLLGAAAPPDDDESAA